MRVLKPAKLQPWEKVGTQKTLAEGHHLRFYEQDFRNPRTGQLHNFFLFTGHTWVSTLALTPENNLILVREYKQGIDGIFYEFSAGVINEGEDPETGARRELEEETGFRAGKMLQLGGPTWPSPRRSDVHFFSFAALGCKSAGDQKLDDIETIEVLEATPQEFWDLVARHELRDAGTIVTALHAARAGLLPLPAA